MSDCYYDAAGCLVCPEQVAVAYVPPRVDRRAVLGWNAGSNSIATHDGNLHAVIPVPAGVVGVVIGLKGSRVRQTVPDLIEHGLYFQHAGGADVVRVVERGAMLTAPQARAADDAFEIRRVNGAVTYLVNGAELYRSMTPSTGAKVLNACLYATGDAL